MLRKHLGYNQLFTPCLTHVGPNSKHCKPCTKLIADGKIDGTLDERIELHLIGRMFTGRALHKCEIPYEEYLAAIGYFPGIDGINAELRANNIPLVIPSIPPYDQEFYSESKPRPLPGKMEELDTYNDKDMLYFDYMHQIYVKDPDDPSKFKRVGYDDAYGGISALPGCQHFFETADSSDDEDTKNELIFDGVALSCIVNGKHYGAVYTGNREFELYVWRGWNGHLTSGSPSGNSFNSTMKMDFLTSKTPKQNPP